MTRASLRGDREIDTFHESSRPDTQWTTVNYGEATPGVPTPLTWSFFNRPVERALREAFHDIGALSARDARSPEVPDERFHAVFYGRSCGNLTTFRSMGDRIPGSSGDAVEAQMFGAAQSELAPTPVRRRYPFVAARFPAAALRSRRRLIAAAAENLHWWRENVLAGVAAENAMGLLEESLRRHVAVTRLHIVATMVVQGAFEQTRVLCARAGLPGLQTALFSTAALPETQMVVDLWELSRGRVSIDHYIERHGYHGPNEGELQVPSWRQDPSTLDGVLAGYRRRDAAADPAAAQRTRVAKRDAAEARLMGGLSAPARARAALLLRVGRAFVPLRETGRGTFLLSWDGARAAARALGPQLAAEGVLDDPEDVFHLSCEELLGGLPANVREVVARRRELRAHYETLDLPERWSGMPQPIADDAAPDGGRVQGIGVNPGRVEGTAVVIDDPSVVDELEPDSILVCRTTDPSWAAVFFMVRGAVIDTGGSLSHGAIVARELGIPCVMNTRNGTRALATGDRIVVDGAEGRVEVLARAAA